MPRPSVREQIVDAAIDQFHLNGYNACGVKLITDTAGVPKGSFYNHFDSKEALALEVITRYTTSHRLEDLAKNDTAPLARLRAHFEFLASDIELRNYTRGCVFGNFTTEAADHSPQIANGVKTAFTTWIKTVATLLREAQEDGSLPTHHDPNTLALFIVNTWEGSIVGARATKNGESFTAFFHFVFNAVLV